jgi:hypothetical protein
MNNTTVLNALFAYLKEVVLFRLSEAYSVQTTVTRIEDIPLPIVGNVETPLSIFIQKNKMSVAELLTFTIALVPHVQADFFDSVIQSFFDKPTDFLPIGGVRGKQFRGVLPTGETVMFIVAGSDLEKRFAVQELLSNEHYFHTQQILLLEEPLSGEPMNSAKLVMTTESIELFTIGKLSKPRFSTSFPAERLETEMAWDELVLPLGTQKEVQDLRIWLQHGAALLHDLGMKRIVKPGYRALFHGPPGTGKTLTAALLGKLTGRDVYRIDLSMIISKFIGETEKNLAQLFDRAENKDWILFFDEADALFGKRTGVRDAHDRYANQEVSYLLQRVETFGGLVILASNFKANIDEAFIRRFQSIIHFPMPRASERLRLWQQSLPPNVALATDVNLKLLAEKYELTGASIVNIVQYCCLSALSKGVLELTNEDLRAGIGREFGKEGKIFS